MRQTRIYQILESLERKKLNRFKKFINSPYFNVNKSIILLGETLIESLKADIEIVSKESIWSKIHDDKTAYSDLKFRKLCNDLLERFERFLIYEELETEKLLQANLLLDSIKTNKFERLIEKQVKKSNRLIEREIDQSAEYYLRVYFNKKILQNLKTNYEKKADIKNALNKLSYIDLSQNLDSFYVIEKLRHATDILTWRKLYKTDIAIDLGFTLDIVEKYDLQSIPAVKVYVLMYKLMSNLGTNEDYEELKLFSRKVIDNFPREEQREILDVQLSYVIKDVNKGDKNAVLEMVKLYEWGIDSEVILSQGYLSPTTFRNYVVGGLRLGLFDKMEEFIKSKQHLLEESGRDNAVNFNLSRVAFYKKNFEEVLFYLNKVNYEDVWYSINSRVYLLAAYYELQEFDALESQLESFSTFLRREKSIQEMKRSSHYNFANRLKNVYKNSLNKDKLRLLRQELADDANVFNKSWLLEKIDELL